MPKRSRKEEGEDITVDEAPTSINPYHVLDLPVDASQDDIKKAYRKAALKSHPDKVAPEDKNAAHMRFQEVAFAYAILSDERRRKRYDTTGRTEESLDLEDDDFDWVDFFRGQFFEVVTQEKIADFEKQFKRSEEERQNVLKAYTKTKGNMTRLYEEVMLSDMLEDEERFREVIDAAIESGEVEEFPKYAEESESARQKRMNSARKVKEQEAKEAEEAAEEMKEEAAGNKKGSSKKSKKTNGAGDLGDLQALIQQRQKGREQNFFENLETKYAPKGKKGGKAAETDEPSDEAFAANRRKKTKN